MKVLHNVNDLGTLEGPVAAAIGVFDGLHLGHQSVINAARIWAQNANGASLVITFDRHPNEIVAPNRVPPAIYPLTKKLQVLEQCRIDATLLLKFDELFSRTHAKDFVQNMVQASGSLRHIFVGRDFVFGHKRSGTLALLTSMGRELGFGVTGMPPILFREVPVSSTRIRSAILAGDFDTVSSLLGRPYSLSGAVVLGDQIGRKLGFPTANLDAAKLALPPFGVYAVQARFEGKQFNSVLNIGVRPTLNSPAPQLRVEVHLLDFDGDLYGKHIDLEFHRKLRDEKRFDSLAALQAQIASDIAEARIIFG